MKTRLALLALALSLGTHAAPAQTVSALPSGGLVQSTDWLPAVRGGVTLKVQPFASPATGSLMIANGTAAPYGLVPVNGSCLEGVGNSWTAVPCTFGSTVTYTGTPANGNLVQFASPSVIQKADLTGDVTTSGGLATTVAQIQGNTVSGTTGTGAVVFDTGPTVTAPAVNPDYDNAGYGLQVNAANTTTGTGVHAINVQAPTVSNSGGFTGLNLGGVIGNGADTSGSNLYGIFSSGPTLSGSDAYNNSFGISIGGPTLSNSAAINNSYGIEILPPTVSGSASILSSRGIYVENMGGSGVTSAYGLFIGSQSGATNNYAIYYNTGQFSVDASGTVTAPAYAGHIANVAGATSAPACGTGCASVTSGSTDVRGSFTTGTSVTAATLDFGTTWGSAPVCTISTSTTATVAGLGTITTGALPVNFAASVSGVKVDYHCIQ